MKHALGSRRSSLSRVAAMLVVLVLVVGMLPVSAFAIVDRPVSGSDAVLAPYTPVVTISGAGWTPSDVATHSPWTSATVTPQIVATVSPSGVLNSVDASVTLFGGSATTTTSAASPFVLNPISTEGTNTINYSANFTTDTVNPFETTTQTAFVRIDKTAPIAPTVTGYLGPFANIATPSVTDTDALSGIKDFEVTGTVTATSTPISMVAAGPTLTFTQAGTYNLHIVAVDNAGNKSPAQTVSFTINDSIAPVTSLVGNAPWFTKDTTFTLAAVDNTGGVGVANTFYSVNSESVYTTYTAAGFPVTLEGTNTVRFYSVDNSNNREATETAYVHIDKTNPVSSIVNPPSGWFSTNATVSVSATDALSGVFSVWTAVDGAGLGSTAGAARTIVVSTEGSHAVTYGAIDVAGNHEATNTVSVRVDKTAPVTSSDATANYTGTASVSLTATDALSGVASTSWRIDSGAYATGTTAVTSLPGTHTVDFYSTDVAGNIETVKHATIHIAGGATYTGLSAGGTLAYGAKGTIAGKLYDSQNATGVAGRVVTLQSSTDGVTFTSSATATTAADGSFSFSASMISKNKTWFRVVSAADGSYPAATSAFVVYTPKVSVTTPSTKSTLRSTRTLSFTAKITPAHTSTKKSSTIAFERYKISGGVHVRRVRYYAKVTSHSGYSSLSRSFKLPKGTWYVRIYAKADSKHALTYSSAKKLKIK